MCKKYIFGLLLLLMLPFLAQAQRFDKKKKYWSAIFTASAMNYFGDIVPKANIASFEPKFTRPNLAGGIQYRFHPRMTVRTAFAWGRVLGDDMTSADPNDLKNAYFRYRRNLHFRTNIYELSTSLVIDLFENRGVFYKRPKILMPYMHIGIGAFYFDPKARAPLNNTPSGVTRGEWVNLRPLQTEGKKYLPVSVAIPVGVGVRYRITNRIDIGAEIGYRFTLTDYIDDVSGNYKDPTTFTGDNASLASAMAMRAGETVNAFNAQARDLQLLPPVKTYTSPSTGKVVQIYEGYGEPYEKRGDRDKDVYMIYGVHLIYIFHKDVGCPRYRARGR